MVFSVTCPECETEFPIDSEKVPDEGVTAQCSLCPATFLVVAPEEPPAVLEDVPAEGVPAEGVPPPSEAVADDGAEDDGAAVPAREPAAGEAPATAAVDAPPVAAFGQLDPDARAARLARVLVSDMMTYNPQMYERALEAGTLADDFEEEVKKSWSEYVEQVGIELATSTPHFNRALNDILAKGDELFESSMYR